MDTRQTEARLHKAAVVILAFSIITSLTLFLSGYFYTDLGNDGGWYSYPGMAYSRGGLPAENRSTVEALGTVEGVKALFPFQTYGSIRVFYTALWFKTVPKNIHWLKALSLIETTALVCLAALMIYTFTGDGSVTLLLTGLLLTDKTIIMDGAKDFRPDIMVAALSVLTFTVMLRSRGGAWVLPVLLSISLLALTHLTAIIPLFLITSFFLLRNIYAGKILVRENLGYVLYGIFALAVFAARDSIFGILFPSNPEPVVGNSSTMGKINQLLEIGPGIFAWKELRRWSDYFMYSNVFELAAIASGVVLFMLRPWRTIKGDPRGLAIATSILGSLVLFAIIDPHYLADHAIPIVPFFLLIVASQISASSVRRWALYAISAMVVLAGAVSVLVAARLGADGRESGYDIVSLRKSINAQLIDKERKYVIIGPTEIWPFIDEGKDVLIIDTARDGKEMAGLAPYIESVDLVFVNRDYASFKWEERFAAQYPGLSLERIHELGSGKRFLRIYRLKKKHPGA